MVKNLIPMVFHIFFMLISTTAFTQQGDFNQLEKQILASIKNKDWPEVLELAKAQINTDIQRAEGYYYSALAFVHLDKSNLAKPYLEHVKKLDQENLYEKVYELEKYMGNSKFKERKKNPNELKPGFIPIKRIDRFFYSYLYETGLPIGLSIGSLNHRGIGTYMVLRSNVEMFTKTGDLTVNSNGNVHANDYDKTKTTGAVRHGVVEGIMGITWKIQSPVWMYVGAGLNHSREFWDIEITNENNNIRTHEWGKNPSRNLNQATIESGFILSIHSLKLRAGSSLTDFDFTRIRYHFGIGFSLKSK